MANIAQMREYISKHPRYKNSMAWRDRCQRMPSNQVVAIYNKFLQQNYTKIERDMQAEKSKPETYHQMDMFEYMEGKR